MNALEQHLDLTPLRGKRRGLVRCPFHPDGTPSLSVDLDQRIWHCFGCGVQGGERALLERLLQAGTIEAATLGRYQAWNRPDNHARRELAERLKSSRRWIAAVRATAKDTPDDMARLAAAAELETAVNAAESELASWGK